LDAPSGKWSNNTNNRVLFVIDTLPNGGAERQLSLLLKYLSPGWKTRVVSLGGGPYYQVLLDQGTSVGVYQRRSRFDLIPAFQLYSEIIRYKPDIIHSWGALCSALVAPICRAFRILLIDGTIRIGGGPSRHYRRTKTTFFLADHIVANSLAGLSANNIPTEKSSVVYNAIDPDRLELSKNKPPIYKDVTTVVMTARISPFKDFPSFFEAARRLSAQEPGCWKFVAIGAGTEQDRNSFVQLAEDLTATGVVDLPQAGLEVLPYVREANIGVLLSASSHKEGVSNSIMEYMACELPVICTDSGGNKELVIDGETGFLIPPEDVDSLIDGLLVLKNHPDLSYRMGKAGYQRVTFLCSIERMISEYEALYTRLLGKCHARVPRNSTDQKRVETGQ
jgi:glycosyltransferase involved in cell wall biosynthesis